MLQHIDGFDYYTNLYYNWHFVGNTTNICVSTSMYRPGSSSPAGSLQVNGAIAQTWIERAVPAASTLVMGFAFYLGYTGASYLFATFGNKLGQDYLAAVALGWNTATSGIDAFTWNGSTWVALGATPGSSLTSGNWYYVEWQNVGGVQSLWINGALYWGGKSAGTITSVSSVALGTSAVLGGASLYFDDLYILDGTGSVNNSPLGNCRVNTMLPSVAGTSSSWTPLSGANYSNVNSTLSGASAINVLDPGFEQVVAGVATTFVYILYAGVSESTMNPANWWTVSPWVFTGSCGIDAVGCAHFTGPNLPLPQGNQVAFIQAATASISQTITGWLAGSYVLSFSAAQSAVSGVVPYGSFNVQVDGVVINNSAGGNTFVPTTSWATYSTVPFTVSGGSHIIKFYGLGQAPGHSGAMIVLLDQVAINPVASNYVFTSTTGSADNYGYSGLASQPVSVFGIKINTVGKRSPGNARQIGSTMLDTGVSVISSAYTLLESHSNQTNIIQTRPYGSAPFSVMTGAVAMSVINAAKYGMTLTT